MTGKAILEALSFVDEAYIEEAETGTLRGTVVLRRVLPMAACLCLILLGLKLWAPSPDNETSDEMEQMVPQQEAMAEPKDEADHFVQDQSECEIVMDNEVVVPNVSEVPTVILRIEEWSGDGFTATVVRNGNTAAFEPGEELKIVFSENICVEEISSDLVTVYRRLPTEPEFPVGTEVLVQYEYITEDGNLLVRSICKEVE